MPGALDVAQGALNPVVSVLTSALGAVVAFVAILTLTVFMLVFGGDLLARLLRLVSAENRPLWERVLPKSYRAVGATSGASSSSAASTPP